MIHLSITLLTMALAPCAALAQTTIPTVDVSGRVELVRMAAHGSRQASADVVVWLSPLQKTADTPSRSAPHQTADYTLTQKDKMFHPHLLVVPVGSSVNFPNLDPFFHNVFSLFNGKRFDLGLYEAHTHRAVRFDREGVSYIFCNIHPDMAAVVVSLGTPFYAVSLQDGSVLLRDVPPGRYRLSVWAENVAPERLAELSRIIAVDAQDTQLGTIRLESSNDLSTHHENKFGEPYAPVPPQQPY